MILSGTADLAVFMSSTNEVQVLGISKEVLIEKGDQRAASAFIIFHQVPNEVMEKPGSRH